MKRDDFGGLGKRSSVPALDDYAAGFSFRLTGEIFFFFLLLLGFFFPAHAAQITARSTDSESAPDCAFRAHLEKMQSAAGQVGVQVISLPSGRVIWEHRSKETFTPASLAKILTSYAALKQLGPYYHFTTSIWALESPQSGTLRGNIWIKSEGDIFLVREKVWTLACKLKESGIRRIQGGVFVDSSFFDPGSEQICLDGNCERSYNPVLSGTSMDFNSITFHVSPGSKAGDPVQVSWLPSGDYVQLKNLAVTAPKNGESDLKMRSMGMSTNGRQKFQASGKLPSDSAQDREYRLNVEDPAAFVARSFKAFLQQATVEVRGTAAGAGIVPRTARKLATYESPPLADLLHGLNRYSNNFMAEMLLRSLGAIVAGPPGTTAKGTSGVQKTLRDLGIAEQQVFLKSGSGLSRECKVSPEALCRVLAAAYQDFSIGPEFLASFAMNSREGTLRNRMRQSGTTVRGKTGTLGNVIGFSGYVCGSDKTVYAVTVLLNDVRSLCDARDGVYSFLEQIPTIVSNSGHRLSDSGS
jgi:D-alanyl-D-alanine carboxypeptidase/D-alanyl-D-alanine-endopeptidase (penicillin-binding protein 4)